MGGKCKLSCSEGLDDCCICCPKNEGCRMRCDEMDNYEYAEYCPYYVKEAK